ASGGCTRSPCAVIIGLSGCSIDLGFAMKGRMRRQKESKWSCMPRCLRERDQHEAAKEPGDRRGSHDRFGARLECGNAGAAEAAARVWLGLVDAGDYAKSWVTGA